MQMVSLSHDQKTLVAALVDVQAELSLRNAACLPLTENTGSAMRNSCMSLIRVSGSGNA